MVPVTPPEHTMADEPSPYLGGQISALRQHITTVNTPGNLDGLVAWYILRGSLDIRWCVDPISGSWLTDNAHRLEDAGPIAVLGYGLSLHPPGNAEVTATVGAGLRRLMQRNPFPGDRLTFLHDIRILFGVCLAAESAKAELPEFRPWLQETLADPRLQPADRFHELAQRHTYATLAGQPVPLGNPSTLTNAGELAMACWMVDRGTANLSNPLDDACMLEQLTMRAVLRDDPSELAVPQAALLLWAADDILGSSVDQMVLSRSHVGMVLRRFEPGMRRWRWDGDDMRHPIRWEVRSEREVRDILWIMLRSVFDDVVDEDTLPKFGHSSYIADFGLPRLGVLVEAKYAYKGADFKKIQDQVMLDSIGYLKNTDRYKEIIVFIYDESASVEHHDLTRRTLLNLDGITDVVIVSRPGILPVPKRTSTGRARACPPA
jgi:hypothetical protein